MCVFLSLVASAPFALRMLRRNSGEKMEQRGNKRSNHDQTASPGSLSVRFSQPQLPAPFHVEDLPIPLVSLGNKLRALWKFSKLGVGGLA